jgi:hypothetical protein
MKVAASEHSQMTAAAISSGCVHDRAVVLLEDQRDLMLLYGDKARRTSVLA